MMKCSPWYPDSLTASKMTLLIKDFCNEESKGKASGFLIEVGC